MSTEHNQTKMQRTDKSCELVPRQKPIPTGKCEDAGETFNGTDKSEDSNSNQSSQQQNWRSYLVATGVFGLGLLILARATGQQLLTIVGMFQMLPQLAVITGVAVGAGLAQHTRDRAEQISAEEKTAVHVNNFDDGEQINVHTERWDKLIAAYEILERPAEVRSEASGLTNGMDRVQQNAPEETMRIVEYALNATPRSDRFLTNEDNRPEEGEDLTFGIDLIRYSLHQAEIDCTVQVLIRSRHEDSSTVLKKLNGIKNGNDKAVGGQVGKLFLDGLANLLSSEEAENHSPVVDEDKREACKAVNSHNTFGITVRAVAFVPTNGPPAAADGLFENIQTNLDTVTNNYVSVTKKTWTEGETNIIGRDWETVRQQFLQHEQFGWRGVLRTRIPYLNTPEFVADSETIWQYCLPTTETTATARREADPRDQNPTERPPQSKLDQLTRDTDGAPANDHPHDNTTDDR